MLRFLAGSDRSITRSYGIYGAPRIHAELCKLGIRVGLIRVARLTHMTSISGVFARHSRTHYLAIRRGQEGTGSGQPELHRSDQGQVVGSRYHLCAYLCGLPLSFRGHRRFQPPRGLMVQGQLSANELITDALCMALCQRRPGEVIHHSDQGSQYTLSGLRQAMQTGRRQALHGLGWRLL